MERRKFLFLHFFLRTSRGFLLNFPVDFIHKQVTFRVIKRDEQYLKRKLKRVRPPKNDHKFYLPDIGVTDKSFSYEGFELLTKKFVLVFNQ